MNAKTKMLLSPVLCALFALTSLGAPTAAQGGEIKELVKKWNKTDEAGNINDILKFYSARSDKAKHMMRDMAQQSAAGGKLQAAIRSKWGADAEQKFATACAIDTSKDDDEAEEFIKDDHAMLKFKNKLMPPLLLIKVGGEWKTDSDAYVTVLGDRVDGAQKAMRTITAILDDASKQLASGSAKNADKFIESVKKKIDAVE